MRDRILAFLVLLPSVLAVGVFVYGFIGQNLWVSLTDWGKDPAQALALRPELRFVGLENYRELFTGFVDVRFRQSVVNLIFFTLFFMAGSLGLGLLLALAVDKAPRGEGFFRTVFLFPMALSFVVTGTIWRWLLQPQGGVNVLPTLFGLPPSPSPGSPPGNRSWSLTGTACPSTPPSWWGSSSSTWPTPPIARGRGGGPSGAWPPPGCSSFGPSPSDGG
ncbi:hypothetical protein TthSNM17_07490 [Thermus thermophilus]|nr:sugar ABC transporter permease [Thermus thermophilus]BDG21087.1 hypothetical protein TthSNM17_07490 [Thermus thermophilus]